MGWKNREIEKKYLVLEMSFDAAVRAVRGNINARIEIADASRDHYWHPKSLMNADFIRVRHLPDGTGELTLKQCDRGSNTDRVEIDVEVGDPSQCRKFLEHLLGAPAGTIHKKYHVFFTSPKGSTVSIYQISGDRRVYLEIEARSLRSVESLARKLGTVLKTRHEARNLYQIFIKSRG